MVRTKASVHAAIVLERPASQATCLTQGTITA